MNIFEDLKSGGELYQKLNDLGLIKKLLDYEKFESLPALGWDLDFDFDDENLKQEMDTHQSFMVYFDGASHELKQEIADIYPSLAKLKGYHHFDFLMINCANDSIAGFGLGRKNKAFAKSSFSGSPFENGVEAFGKQLPYDFANEFQKTFDTVGQAIYNMDLTPDDIDGADEDEYDSFNECLSLFFPNFEMGDLDTGDY